MKPWTKKDIANKPQWVRDQLLPEFDRRDTAKRRTPSVPPRTAPDLFQRLCEAEGLPMPEREVRFCERLWRFDYAIAQNKIAIEVEGGVWTEGRHVRGPGYVADMEKYSAAAALGWCVLRTTPDALLSAGTLDMIREALHVRACRDETQGGQT